MTQFILALAITLFLLNRLRSQRTPSLLLLTAFFAPMTVFSGLLVFNAALLPFPRLLTVFAENAFLGLALAGLNGFAYHFPKRYPQHKWEMRIVLTLSLAYFFWEVGFMIFRYTSLLGQGDVFIRPALVAYSVPIITLFAPLACLRQALAADPRPVAWWRKLWKPEGKDAQGARNFALVLGILVVLGIINALVFFGLSLTVIHAIISIGILITYWLFANNYVNFIPGSVDVASRLSILVLTLFLALLGTLGLLIAPSYIATYQPDLPDHQTLRFTPSDTGGYDVSEVDFHFESALGEKVRAHDPDENGNQRVEFTFPFYGKTHTEAYVTYYGAISLGQPFNNLNLQSDAARAPTLFPLVISLTPDPVEEDSGLYIRREPERLIVTWNRMLAHSQPETRYTFQSILYANGIFEFTYNGLPHPILFNPNAVPTDYPLLRGVVAGRGELLYELPGSMDAPADLVTLSRAGASPLLENHLLAFRRHLHTFMLPVAWVVIGGSLLILLLIPLLLHSSIARPLEALTAGVRRMGTGELNVTIPVQSEDEIGFLTQSFNTMSGELNTLITNLEFCVATRTVQLTEANHALQKSQKFFEELFEASPDAILAINPQGNIKQVNTQVETMFGYSRAKLIGQPIEVVIPARFAASHLPKRAAHLAKPSARAMGDATALFGCRKDGSEFPVDIRLSPVEFTEGQLTLVVVRDISARVELEQSLQQAQAELLNQQLSAAGLEERQHLARNLHDTLIQSIHSLVLFSETLTAAIEKNNLERAKQIVGRVQESARQSHKETRLMLYELQAPGQKKNVNLMRDLEERLTKVENHAGILSEIIQNGSLEHIPASWHENLYWIAIEALNNALKHAQAHKMQILIHATPQRLEMEVVDDGRGFVPGHTLSGGMGLENMRVRARLLGGELTIESELLKGTRVRFCAEIREK
jgi:PAS domain S-box-containing protein